MIRAVVFTVLLKQSYRFTVSSSCPHRFIRQQPDEKNRHRDRQQVEQPSCRVERRHVQCTDEQAGNKGFIFSGTIRTVRVSSNPVKSGRNEILYCLEKQLSRPHAQSECILFLFLRVFSIRPLPRVRSTESLEYSFHFNDQGILLCSTPPA